MFFNKEDMPIENKSNLKGGNGTIIYQHIIPEEKLFGESTLFATMTINPGCSIGPHAHTSDLEVYYVLSGTAKVRDGAEERILHAGDAEMCDHGNVHAVECVGDVPAVVLGVKMNTK